MNKQNGVYLIRYEGITKIGITTDLANRLSNFYTHSPFPERYEVITYIKTDDADIKETLLHSHFKNKNINREWFDLTDDDIAFCIDVISGKKTLGACIEKMADLRNPKAKLKELIKTGTIAKSALTVGMQEALTQAMIVKDTFGININDYFDLAPKTQDMIYKDIAVYNYINENPKADTQTDYMVKGLTTVDEVADKFDLSIREALKTIGGLYNIRRTKNKGKNVYIIGSRLTTDDIIKRNESFVTTREDTSIMEL